MCKRGWVAVMGLVLAISVCGYLYRWVVEEQCEIVVLEDRVSVLEGMTEQLENEIGIMQDINKVLKEGNEALSMQNEKVLFENQELKEVEVSDIQDWSVVIPVSYNHETEDEEYVFIENDEPMRWFPEEDAPVAGYTNFERSLVRVLDKAHHLYDDKYWYYIEGTNYAEAYNTKGWIRADKTRPYTEELQLVMSGPVGIREGAMVYENAYPDASVYRTYDELVEHSGTPYQYHIEMKDEEYTVLVSYGAQRVWVYSEDIIYPEVK